jgi:threonine dehydrogenase-like Zn-dependent dehydrogenase
MEKPSTMKAARFHGTRDIRIEQIPVPTTTSSHALVDVEWCGICGTDLHEYLAGPVLISPRDEPHALTGAHMPVTMGHEFCGRVRQLPNGYHGSLTVGQSVMVDPRIPCRSCKTCKDISTNFCPRIGFLGLNGQGGGLSETVAVDVKMCYALPEDADLGLAALIEPLSVARHAVRVSGLTDFSNTRVLILGGGPIGQAVALTLKIKGRLQVIVSEPAGLRREQIKHLSDAVIDPITQDIVAECQFLTFESGIDLVFDCAGAPSAMNAAFDALKVRGIYVNVAVAWESPVSDSWNIPWTKLRIL